MPKITQEITETKYLRDGDIIHYGLIDAVMKKTPFYFSNLEIIENYVNNYSSCSIIGNIILDHFYVYIDGYLITNISGLYHSYQLNEITSADKISKIKVYETNDNKNFVKIDHVDVPCENRETIINKIKNSSYSPIVCLIGEEKYNYFLEMERTKSICNIL